LFKLNSLYIKIYSSIYKITSLFLNTYSYMFKINWHTPWLFILKPPLFAGQALQAFNHECG
jgi:hypothetical protein